MLSDAKRYVVYKVFGTWDAKNKGYFKVLTLSDATHYVIYIVVATWDYKNHVIYIVFSVSARRNLVNTMIWERLEQQKR